MTRRALSGVNILDLTQFEAGTSCTEFLGWLGANVIKIEGPTGDQGRRTRSSDPKETDSIYFQLFNCNKRSIVIDLKKPEGRELFLRMVPHGDVVIENFAPGVMEKLNLDYPVLKEINPRIIMARIKGFGLSGPYKDYKCFESIAQAAGGAISSNGEKDRPPIRVGIGVGDSGTGVHTAVSIVAALLQRRRTGRGQFIESSMQESVANVQRVYWVDHDRTKTFAERAGNDAAFQAPSGTFPCAPGGPNDYVFLIVNRNSERMWRGLLQTIGREELAEDPRFKDNASRWANKEATNAIVADWTRQRTKHEAMRALASAGVPCSAIMDTADVLNDPHLNGRDFIVTVDHPVRGPLRMPGSPFRLSDSPVEITPSPLLGQHTDEILKEVLNPGDAEIADLRGREVVA